VAFIATLTFRLFWACLFRLGPQSKFEIEPDSGLHFRVRTEFGSKMSARLQLWSIQHPRHATLDEMDTWTFLPWTNKNLWEASEATINWLYPVGAIRYDNGRLVIKINFTNFYISYFRLINSLTVTAIKISTYAYIKMNKKKKFLFTTPNVIALILYSYNWTKYKSVLQKEKCGKKYTANKKRQKKTLLNNLPLENTPLWCFREPYF